GWQKRCTTPQPTDGDTGSVMGPGYGAPGCGLRPEAPQPVRARRPSGSAPAAGLLLAAAPPAGHAGVGWRPSRALARPGRHHGQRAVGLGLGLVGLDGAQ